MAAYITKRARETPPDIFEVRMFNKLMEGKALTPEERAEIWADKEFPEPTWDELDSDDAGIPCRGEI